MENPVDDVEYVIRQLTQTTPSAQRKAVETYFTTDAAFSHPFCRTGSFDGSRFLVLAIYRWYKIMSPSIDLKVNSVAYDADNLILYANISQIFRIWVIPFFSAHVTLTSVLRLKHDKFERKYYIRSQEDLYQVNQFVKFFFPGGFVLVWLWQIFATLMCLLGAVTFWPISWLEDHGGEVKDQARRQLGRTSTQERNNFVERPKGSGNLVTAPAVQQR